MGRGGGGETNLTIGEEALISEMKIALRDYMKPDSREGGYFFESESLEVFQGLAHDVASLIEKQGLKNTCTTIKSVAEQIKGLSDVEWNHANSLGFAFKKGLALEAISGPKANPFTKKNFPKP